MGPDCDGFVDVFVRFHGLEYAHCTSIKLFENWLCHWDGTCVDRGT